jgi:hypothetical protein
MDSPQRHRGTEEKEQEEKEQEEKEQEEKERKLCVSVPLW